MTRRTSGQTASAAVLEPLPAAPVRRTRTPACSAPTRPGSRPVPAHPDPDPGLARELRALLGLRGVSYACTLDEGASRVTGSCGSAPGEHVPLALAAWARSSRGLPQDVMITTATGCHLLQYVPAGAPANPTTAAVWVYLHVDRAQGVVEVPRRALAALAGLRTRPAPAPPVQEGPPARTGATVIPLPRRSSSPVLPPAPRRPLPPEAPGDGAPGRPAVLSREWATDRSTMERLLDGLRRLA